MNELLTALGPWVKAHSRVSVHTLRRRFGITRAEVDALIAALIQDGQLAAVPEGESYRVRYSTRTRKGRGPMTPQDWFNPQGNPDRRHTPLRTITTLVRTTRERSAQPVREPAEATA